MSTMSEKQLENFGSELRLIRKKNKESLADVSGAVEIDVRYLSDIELGKKRPTEDILLLIISHFSLREDEALKLWQLAGFDQGKFGVSSANNLNDGLPYLLQSSEQRIVYTDMVHVSANNYGVVINFLQGLGADGKPVAISRIGMSREHAKSLIEVLEKTIGLSERPQQKQLPESKA